MPALRSSSAPKRTYAKQFKALAAPRRKSAPKYSKSRSKVYFKRKLPVKRAYGYIRSRARATFANLRRYHHHRGHHHSLAEP